MVLWKTRWRMHITSSNAGEIAKRRASTPVGHRVQQLLYSTFQGNKAKAWGLSQEEASLIHYMEWLQEQSPAATVIINCGLVISPVSSYTRRLSRGSASHSSKGHSLVYSCKDSSIDDTITSLFVSQQWHEIAETFARLLLPKTICYVVYRNKVVWFSSWNYSWCPYWVRPLQQRILFIN